ncbi:Neutral/alkaline nonlysosomal ceramidase [Guyanagaster necrorhizus]|uniref:Neutral ceramidase n=1 Tax=Guyanagaster necrorhizus TaxID=856835 RepID=A0A9P8AML5_9AGAR|nr:Neutral/alkaline nonlysosomal ceramidase [Guyanagaster necrorhizus MCA 3950]KAG7441035.1 Neutral/alkaline nonlysosomal ceramidase [Guyanagaster necrorhizus MCA 3950]
MLDWADRGDSPIVETNMMGYASLAQTDTGLHMRQFSRVFIVADASDPSSRILFINSDIAMGDSGVRRSIVAELTDLYPGVYTNENIAMIGTHQHSGVGGYLENLLPQITSLGYVPQTADAIVTGTVLAAQRAHDSLAPGSLSLGNTTVLDANINRSPSAYLFNPAEERARYEYDQDKDLTLLRFDDDSGTARGFLSFFAVHGTSLYENNTLVSSDNKGMAAYLYESMVEPDAMPGNATFVAGFTQANVGDTSPNTLGAFCESPGEDYDGLPCDFDHSTCGGTVEDCHGRGPGFRVSDFESNRIIGEKQFEGALTIMDGGTLAPVSGSVRSVHVYMDMANHTFTLPNGTTVQTCPAAMGFSFAGGTTDGPGAFDFIQGDNSSNTQNPFWELVKDFVTPAPSQAQIDCQDPKPILLNTGYAHFPYEWSPSTVDIQMLRVGNFVMLIMPGELTTMSGRRIREAIRAELIALGILGEDAYVVIAGPANTYAHYVATREEYGAQRYEGASTIFGQYTLEAYIDRYTSLVPFLGESPSGTPASDAAPAEQTSKAISLQTGVVFDAAPIGKQFGDVLADVGASYVVGDTVTAQFVGADPRNNLRLGSTFLTVDQQVSGQWVTVKSDAHPSTTLKWNRTSTILGTSTVDISWTIESGTPAGTYRIVYYGDSKPLIGAISSFSGISSTFTVS